MHWATAMKNIDGMATYAVRHEHCACAMAIGLWNIHASDKVVSPNTRRGVGRGHGKM